MEFSNLHEVLRSLYDEMMPYQQIWQRLLKVWLDYIVLCSIKSLAASAE
jgi:hypothetical protein